MKCRKCGAILLDTDTFCVKCGQKVGQPMFCSNCGEELREGERFCHKCGTQVESAPDEEEIPISQQKTVDIPFDQIEQGILLEAKQAIVKRPEAERQERRNPEDYRRPGMEEPVRRRQAPVEEPEYYEEDYEDYEEDDDDEEEYGDSRMKAITIILGIVVLVVALAIGFIFWRRNSTSRYERPDEGTEQGETPGEDGEDGGNEGDSADTQGRLQILSNVNVRNAPTTEGSEVLMVAKQGETYEYYELVDDAWYRIKLEDGGEGYVSSKYVEDLE